MTQDEKRIKIAEACPDLFFIDSDNSVWWKSGIVTVDPFNDLNAMHEATETLTDIQQMLMRNWLEEIVERPGVYKPGAVDWNKVHPRFWNATAAQRAEAFGLTLNLWQPCPTKS